MYYSIVAILYYNDSNNYVRVFKVFEVVVIEKITTHFLFASFHIICLYIY